MSTNQLRAAAGKETSPITKMSQTLDKMKKQIALALPKHVNPDRMARLALTCFSTNADLQKCTEHSIIASIMTASQLGLEIGVNGQGYLIPYKNTCTFVPGWKGLIDIVNRAGRATAWTGAVFQGDEFSYELGADPYLKHKPAGENDPAKMLYAYAIGRVNGSDWPIIECWTNERLLKHRDKHNKVGARHYSFQNWEMYARKVVLLQAIKYLPSSIEMRAAIDLSDRVEDGMSGAVIDGDFVVSNVESDPQEPAEPEQKPADSKASKDSYAAYQSKIVKAADANELKTLVAEIEADSSLSDIGRHTLLKEAQDLIALAGS